MAACENLQNCPFYQGKMSMESGLGSMYKKRYCEGDKLLCARYTVASRLGKEYMPPNLYPNMMDKAREILEKNHVKFK